MRFALAVVLGAALAGCSRTPPLADATASPQALAQEVLTALTAGDRRRLEALALSEGEFRGHVWPSLPAAREERNLPFSYVWGDLRQKSAQSLSAILAEHGHKEYALLDVSFNGQTDYGPYTVHREATFVVRLPSGGTERLHLCGSMLEKDGNWKVFSYIVDE